MGQSSSEPRRVTIIRADDIHFTEAVLDRLKQSSDEQGSPMDNNSLGTSAANLLNPDCQEIEKMYEERLSRLEKRNEQLFVDSAQEFSRTVERVEKKFLHPPFEARCFNEQKLIRECYQKNPAQTLLCAAFVTEYEKCVRMYQMASLERQKKSAAAA